MMRPDWGVSPPIARVNLLYLTGWPVARFTEGSMKLDARQRRDLILLACKMAWADGVIQDEERQYVRGLAGRFANGAVSSDELDDWLLEGAPEPRLDGLTEDMGETFFFEVLAVMESDGDIAEQEKDVLCQLMARIFEKRPRGVPLAKIRLVRRSVSRIQAAKAVK